MQIKEMLHKSPSKRSFRNGIHIMLRRAGARGSADIVYRSLYVTHIASLWVRHSY